MVIAPGPLFRRLIVRDRFTPPARHRAAVRRARQFVPGRLDRSSRLEDRVLLATINVTTTADIVSSSDGLTSLREAVNTATNAAGSSTIVVPAGQYDLTSSSGELLLGKIAGQNITIQGGRVGLDHHQPDGEWQPDLQPRQ